MADTYTMTDHLIVFFNQYRQLALYNKNVSSGYISGTYVLLQTSGSMQRFVNIRRNDYQLELTCESEVPDGYTPSISYDFSDDAGQIWFDHQSEPSIVIGMGDIRDGVSGELRWYKIPHVDETNKGLYIECASPYELIVHCKGLDSENEGVSDDSIVCKP